MIDEKLVSIGKEADMV